MTKKEKETEKRRIAYLLRKVNRKEKNEESFTGKSPEYYIKLKEGKPIKDSPERTDLIKSLMKADKITCPKTSHVWIFEQWDSLKTEHLKYAWNTWGERACGVFLNRNLRNI